MKIDVNAKLFHEPSTITGHPEVKKAVEHKDVEKIIMSDSDRTNQTKKWILVKHRDIEKPLSKY